MRLAHVSDLHLLSLSGVKLSEFLNKRWLGGVNLLFNRGHSYRHEIFDALVDDLNEQRVDHVLCTGDLTNLALKPEFRFARERFDRIALGPQGVTCIPGNHDRYVRSSERMFEEFFAPYCTSDAGTSWESWPVLRVRGELAIIGLSTGKPSPWLMAYGRVGAEQLARLEHFLRDLRLKDKFRMVLLHHPPLGRAAGEFHRGLRDRRELLAVLERAGAELVLHGHEHLDLRAEHVGPLGTRIPVHGIQSGSYGGHAAQRLARYRIYRIEPQPGRRPVLAHATLRAWDAARGKFLGEGGSG
ncbi:MAG: metallophosphoesterase [Deltaproteobacteria bacterium]|nr:metallophosphoesterase [Deltaproteobacteria bacterium]